MHYNIRQSITTLIIVVLLSIIIPSSVTANSSVNPYWYRIIGGQTNIDVIVVERYLEKQTSRFTSRLSIPVIHARVSNDMLEQLNGMFYQGITHYASEVENIALRAIEQLVPDQPDIDIAVNVEYVVNYNAGGILSITVLFQQDFGNLKPGTFAESVNIDITTGRIIEFNDLFVSQFEIDALVTAINEQMALRPGTYPLTYIDQSALTLLQSFYITENKIVVSFDTTNRGSEFMLELSTVLANK